MGQVKTIIEEWYAGDEKKEKLYKQMPGLILRWINEGQLRYCDLSEILEGTWNPTITSSGYIALPADFLKETQDRVKWTDGTPLINLSYEDALIITDFAGTNYYSIWGGNFYVWAATAGTPTIPYIKKPTIVVIANIASADLEIPTEDQTLLTMYLDGRYLRHEGRLAEAYTLVEGFDNKCKWAGQKFRDRRDPIPFMRSSRF